MSKWLALLLCIPCLAWGGASRDFAASAFDIDTAAATAHPVSMVCWINADVLGKATALFIGDKDVGNHYFKLGIGDSPFRIVALVRAGSVGRASTGISPTTGTWHLASGVFVTSANRKAQIDAANEGTDSTDRDPLNEDRTGIGGLRDSTPGETWDGKLAYCAVWTGTGADLTDAEIDELAAGMWTSWIDTGNLTGFWTVMGDTTANEPDLSGVTGAMVPANDPASDTSGPPVFFPIGGM